MTFRLTIPAEKNESCQGHRIRRPQVLCNPVCATLRVNFINVLLAAFTWPDHKCAKRLSSHQCLLALLGPTLLKASCKMLMELTPDYRELDDLGKPRFLWFGFWFELIFSWWVHTRKMESPAESKKNASSVPKKNLIPKFGWKSSLIDICEWLFWIHRYIFNQPRKYL